MRVFKFVLGHAESVVNVIADTAVWLQTEKSAEELIDEQYIEIEFVHGTDTKPYMDYRTVTDSTSKQYELLTQATADENGLLYIDEHLCVALGSKYGKVGSRYLMNIGGTWYKVIKADEKADCDTKGGWMGKNGHILEMIVDTSRLPNDVKILGDCNLLVNGDIREVKKER